MDYSHPVLVESLLDLDDEDLELIAGPATLARGLIYAKRGHVLDVAVVEGGSRLDGQVQGSQGRAYRTTVRLIPDENTDVAYWQSTCTCPMDRNCKHTVALVAAARAD